MFDIQLFLENMTKNVYNQSKLRFKTLKTSILWFLWQGPSSFLLTEKTLENLYELKKKFSM